MIRGKKNTIKKKKPVIDLCLVTSPLALPQPSSLLEGWTTEIDYRPRRWIGFKGALLLVRTLQPDLRRKEARVAAHKLQEEWSSEDS